MSNSVCDFLYFLIHMQIINGEMTLSPKDIIRYGNYVRIMGIMFATKGDLKPILIMEIMIENKMGIKSAFLKDLDPTKGKLQKNCPKITEKLSQKTKNG